MAEGGGNFFSGDNSVFLGGRIHLKISILS